jgi:predicted amidohydrolase YtcJ
VIDAAGGTLTPGLTDAHLHLLEWARATGEVSVDGASSPTEVARRVAAFVADHPGDTPVIGRGWDANLWDVAPERSMLDRVCPARPVLLHSRDFHALWANGAALGACGITAATSDPAGGRIVRDAAGEPSGILMENAVRLCARLFAEDDGADAAAVEVAITRLLALGVTGVHDFEGLAAQRLLSDRCWRGEPRLRVLMHVAHSALNAALDSGLRSGAGDDRFRIGAVKLFADGTLGSRTAAMLAPYEGTRDTGVQELETTVARCFDAGLSVAIHAIGDRAVRSALNAFEHAERAIATLALPPRIEHLQLVDPTDLPRFARLGVAASMQPSHAISDAALAERHWGSRVRASYPWRDVLDSGAVLAFGSDAPVEPPRPAAGLEAAVARRGADPARPFTPHQRITLDEALAAYTSGPARLAGQWPRVGTLRPGAEADFVVWNTDLHALEPSRLGEAAVSATWVQGRVVWSAGDPSAAAGGASRPATISSRVPA